MITQFLQKRRFASGVIAGVILIIIVTVLTFLIVHGNQTYNGLPHSILKRVSFTTYTPNSSWLVDDVTYQNNVLMYTATESDITINVSEQTSPQTFTDIPQYFPALLSKLNQYAEISSKNGSVYLTKPTELNGQQSAVLNSSGTLLFARPNKSLNNSQWQHFFNSLKTSAN